MEFSADERVRGVQRLLDALFEHVLYDEEPMWIGDEATLFDVSLAPPDELLRRCSEYYKTHVTADDLHKPLWQLLPELETRRKAAE